MISEISSTYCTDSKTKTGKLCIAQNIESPSSALAVPERWPQLCLWMRNIKYCGMFRWEFQPSALWTMPLNFGVPASETLLTYTVYVNIVSFCMCWQVCCNWIWYYIICRWTAPAWDNITGLMWRIKHNNVIRCFFIFNNQIWRYCLWWWSGIAVARWSQSAKLTYVGPG